MAVNGWTLLEMAVHFCKWLEMARMAEQSCAFLQCLKMAGNGLKYLEMAEHG